MSKDGETVVYCYFRILSHPLSISLPVRLKGLEPDGIYKLEENDVCYGGDELMYSGITSYPEKQDFSSHIYIFRKVNDTSMSGR